MSRRLGLKRWYSHPQGEMISEGKRKPRYDGVTTDSPSSDPTGRMIMPPEKATTQPDNAGTPAHRTPGTVEQR